MHHHVQNIKGKAKIGYGTGCNEVPWAGHQWWDIIEKSLFGDHWTHYSSLDTYYNRWISTNRAGQIVVGFGFVPMIFNHEGKRLKAST